MASIVVVTSQLVQWRVMAFSLALGYSMMRIGLPVMYAVQVVVSWTSVPV
jgi:hypothetical protein